MQRVVIILFAFVTLAYAKEMVANRIGNAQGSIKKFADTMVDTLADELVLRTRPTRPLYPTDLDKTTLAKTRPCNSHVIPSNGRAMFSVSRPLIHPLLKLGDPMISLFPFLFVKCPHSSKTMRVSGRNEDKGSESGSIALDDVMKLLSSQSDLNKLSEGGKADVRRTKSVATNTSRRHKLPTIAIIGRPNVGKSTVINRLTERFRDGAIAFDEPGVTRDRTYRRGEWNGYNFELVDTGGLLFDVEYDKYGKFVNEEEIFAKQIKEQAEKALAESDIALFVCDGQEGRTAVDDDIADFLRKNCKVPIYLVVNKCESGRMETVSAKIGDFWTLGLGQPYPISAMHGTGVYDMLEIMTATHMERFDAPEVNTSINIAIVGRPNVGKSSLFNQLNGDTRAIVSDIAGTTRDTIDSIIKYGNDSFKIIDTAGIRRKRGVKYGGVEFLMINRAFKAISKCDVVVLLIDAVDGITQQDKNLAARIVDEGRGCVIALNKWDAVPNKDRAAFQKALEDVREKFPDLWWAPVIVSSALKGQGIQNVLKAVKASGMQFKRRVSTSTLMMALEEIMSLEDMPKLELKTSSSQLKSVPWKLHYGSQTSACPPTFTIFMNSPDLVTGSHRTYLETKLREILQFDMAPIRLYFREKRREKKRNWKEGKRSEEQK